jgi:hypothetical protein
MAPAGSTPSRGFLAGAFLAALLFRLVGLGGSSMWLDEILETLMAEGSLRQLFSALLYDRAQPPLEPLFTWALWHLGLAELARRFVNLLLGAAMVALFARWVGRRFGTPAAAVTALFLASSPVLVRYSHELRPYALWLLLAVWALDAADRWIARGAERFPAELVAVAAAASITHYFAIALWLPVAAAWLEGRLDGTAKPPAGRMHAGAVALAIAPLALWLAAVARWGGPHQAGPLPVWTIDLVEKRFEDLLLRGYAWQPAVDHAMLLFAALAVVGFIVVARRRGGLPVLAGLVAGTIFVELALIAAKRFTHFRYDQFGLLFLYAAMAAGIVTFAGIVARWNRASGIATAALLAAAVVATAANGLVGYAQHGRPDWSAVARAVEALDGRDARIAATIPWARISLGYYLDRYRSNTGWPRDPDDVPVLFNDRARLKEELARAPRCLPVVEAGWPRNQHLFDGLRPKSPVLRWRDTDDVRIFRFAPRGAPRRDCLPPEGFTPAPSPGYGRLFPWLSF